MINPTNPQVWHRMRVKTGDGSRTERFSRRPTYEYQLEAFCAAVLRGEPTLTPPADSIANMRVLDAIYVAAGMMPRWNVRTQPPTCVSCGGGSYTTFVDASSIGANWPRWSRATRG